MIPRTEVKSSNVRSVGYDSATRRLHVEFNSKDARMPGRIYEYADVTPEDHRSLMLAQSKGAYFSRFIKGRYPGRVVGKPVRVVRPAESAS